jgi:hypothetical protein
MMNIFNINSVKRNKVASIIADITEQFDDIDNIVISYTKKDEVRLYSAWSGDRSTGLLGMLLCTIDDIMNDMRD